MAKTTRFQRQKLERQLVIDLKRRILTAVEYGDFTQDDFRNPGKFNRKFRKAIFGDRIIDYKPSILEQARAFAKEGQIDFAKLFYTIYFEHYINRIIFILSKKKGLNEGFIKNVIRSVNVEAKFSWLLELLDLPKINAIHLKILEKLFEQRNAFVHYKWNQKAEIISHKAGGTKATLWISKELWEAEFRDIEKCIVYLKRYESRIIYAGKTAKIKKMVDRMNLQVKMGDPI